MDSMMFDCLVYQVFLTARCSGASIAFGWLQAQSDADCGSHHRDFDLNNVGWSYQGMTVHDKVVVNVG